jgi:hypothetical protein
LAAGTVVRGAVEVTRVLQAALSHGQW